MDFAVFDEPRPEVTEAEASAIAADLYGLVGVASALAGERDRSFRLDTDDASFVLKVGNAADRPEVFEAQAKAIIHALTSDPELPLARVVPTRRGTLTGTYGPHPVQLAAFITGSPSTPAPTTPGLRRSIGSLAGRVSRALRGYDHPALHRLFPWNMMQLPLLAPLLEFVPEHQKGVLDTALGKFDSEVLPELRRLGDQMVHGDIHDDNIVTDPFDSERIVGLFDFGDMSPGPRVVEVGVAATYQCFGSDPVEAIAQVVSAFHVVDRLTPEELALVPELVSARCVQSALMAARHVATHPDNAHYASADAGDVWATLDALRGRDRSAVMVRLRRACGFRAVVSPGARDVLERRRRRLGPSLQLSYDSPVHVRRGEGVWMIDGEGRRLLDAYNNVPQVGHAHPEVVSAIAAQVGILSTNTRYLVDEVVEYAERLAGLFPDPLNVVMFTNSGSEANDLAYQIAVTITGRQGLITTDHAYHGTTLATAAMSPTEYETPAHAEQLPGAALLADIDGVDRLGDQLADARLRLATRGHEPAMVIFDTVFSSEGIYDLPAGFMAAARQWTADEAALLVADEVQAGFGRVGTRFWGFAGDTVVPDLVTLGKPMGNGHPIGAVVTSSEVAARFAQRGHFFSTFAGSPVAAAAGMAVLDVIEAEDLAENAERVGDYLRRAISALEYPGVIASRGPGLFLGVQMRDHTLARTVVQAMRERGVLIGSTGPNDDVLKIRPPLVFTERHADILLDCLVDTLTSI